MAKCIEIPTSEMFAMLEKISDGLDREDPNEVVAYDAVRLAFAALARKEHGDVPRASDGYSWRDRINYWHGMLQGSLLKLPL